MYLINPVVSGSVWATPVWVLLLGEQQWVEQVLQWQVETTHLVAGLYSVRALSQPYFAVF